MSTATKDKTTAGNYFVSNYPPFSFWEKEKATEAIQALQTSPKPDTNLGLYAHIPFCRKRCHFCYFRVYTGKDAKKDLVTNYLDALLKELEIYADSPLVKGRKPKYIYFGGGTPSFLTPDQMKYLFDGMKNLLPWDDVEEVAFECEPGTLTEEKLRTLRESGITRISLGIENFDDNILKTNGRAHLSKEIYSAYDYARSIGFDQINIDLIAGMLNETPENWQYCIEKTLELQPDCVTIYQMEIPFNTTIYKEMQERGDIVAPIADWPTKRAWVQEAFSALEADGYSVTSAYTAVKDPEKFKFLYRDYLWSGADMVSLGTASFGHLNGTHYQNEKDQEPYVARLNRNELPIYRALTMSEDEGMLRELILHFKLGTVKRDYYLEKFNVDIYKRFESILQDYENQGYLTRDENTISITREALLFVDNLLHAFFLPQHQDARYT